MSLEQNASSRILNATITAVSKEGLHGLTTRRIAKLAGTSASNIYTFFNGKDEVLERCFYLVDKEIAAIFSRVSLPSNFIDDDPRETAKKVWLPFFNYLIGNPDKAMFYLYFRISPDFPEFHRTRRDDSFYAPFLEIVGAFGEKYKMFEKTDIEVFWIYVLHTTLLYAKYVNEGVIPNTPESVEGIFNMIYGGIGGLMKK